MTINHNLIKSQRVASHPRHAAAAAAHFYVFNGNHIVYNARIYLTSTRLHAGVQASHCCSDGALPANHSGSAGEWEL